MRTRVTKTHQWIIPNPRPSIQIKSILSQLLTNTHPNRPPLINLKRHRNTFHLNNNLLQALNPSGSRKGGLIFERSFSPADTSIIQNGRNEEKDVSLTQIGPLCAKYSPVWWMDSFRSYQLRLEGALQISSAWCLHEATCIM